MTRPRSRGAMHALGYATGVVALVLAALVVVGTLAWLVKIVWAGVLS